MAVADLTTSPRGLPMADTTEDQLLNLSRQLLDAIDGHDRELYAEMCDPSLTAFEPEAAGNLVSGMSFHDFYLQRDPPQPPRRSTISGPHVRVMGDVAVVSYVRLVQSETLDGRMTTTAMEETRVWQRQDDRWRHVPFHRSPAGRSDP